MPTDEPFVLDPVVNGTYDMCDDMERIAKLCAVVAYKYFATDLEFTEWRTKAKQWLADDEFPLQGLQDVLEEILNEAYLFPVDYEAEPCVQDLESEGTPVYVGQNGAVHNVGKPDTGNLQKSGSDVTMLSDDTHLVCDMCQIAVADRWVEHLNVHLCADCHWKERLHGTTDSLPNHKPRKDSPSERPDHDRRPDREPSGGGGTPEPDTLSWDVFAGTRSGEEALPA